MNRQLFFFLIVLISTTNFSWSQSFVNSTSRLYNDYLNSPSFIQAKRSVQFNLIGESDNSNMDASSSINFNTIVSLDKISSGFILGINKTQNSRSNFNKLKIGYSYKYPISDNLNMSIGLEFNFLEYEFKENYLYSIDIIPQTIYDKEANFGLGIKSNNLTLSTSFYFAKDYSLDSNMIFQTINDYNNLTYIKYKFNISNLFHISPQIVNIIYKSDEPNHLYLGITADYKDIAGVGIDYWGNINLSAFYNIKDRVTIMARFYSGDSSLYDDNYGWTIMGQIQINI